MGKHRFRLSDMMPNAWFYKLKDMNKTHPPPPNPSKLRTQRPPPPPPSNQQCQKQGPPLIPNRASYYFPSNSPAHPKATDTTHFPPDSRSPRKSSTPRPRRRLPTAAATSPRLLSVSNISSTCSRASVSESDSSDVHNSYCICNTNTNTPTTAPAPPKLDVVLDLVGSELELRPILTKPPASAKPKKQDDDTLLKRPPPPHKNTTTSAVQPRLRSSSARRTSSSAASPGRKVRVARRRSRRGGIDESFAVVKSSSDPRRDFRESMIEMILEKKLTASKDLEDLLACYLSLNSNEYHDVIVKVFEEIWLDITDFVNK